MASSSSTQPTSSTNNNSKSKSKSKAKSNSIPHGASSISASTSPTPRIADSGSATSPRPSLLASHTQGHTHTNSHDQSYHNQSQHEHQHAPSHVGSLDGGGGGGGGVEMNTMSDPSIPSTTDGHVPSSSGTTGMGGVGQIPGAPFYYHPYNLFPSHSHHGPPPPHPPAPPAPPRAHRANSQENNHRGETSHTQFLLGSASPYATTSTSTSTPPPSLTSLSTSASTYSVSVHEGRNSPSRPNGPSSSRRASINNNNSPIIPSSTTSTFPTLSLSSSSFHASSDMSTSRPQLIPTFQYYRSQTNYDKQHRRESSLRGRSTSILANDDNEEEEDDNDNDNDHSTMMGDYGGSMSMSSAMEMHPGMGLRNNIGPPILPSTSIMPQQQPSFPPSSNFMLPGSEKRPNHEYYPSAHHQAQFRELMAGGSAQLPDPPISLNSLVDSEPGKKPAYPLPTIIRCAILGSPHERLTLSELYLAMERRFSYYTIGDGKAWRNSVRHNLSLNNLFEKVARPITEPGKGCYWVVAHDKPPGNKRERKRNKKPGKKALAAMEREKAAAAAGVASSSTQGLASGGRTDDENDEDDGGEDDDDDEPDHTAIMHSRHPSTSSAATMSRRRTTQRADSSTASRSNAAPFSAYLPATAAGMTARPLFPFSRGGTVVPNEGSYAAVTGIVPMPSQVPLPASFGVGMGVGSHGGYGGGLPQGIPFGQGGGGGTTSGSFSAFTNNNAGHNLNSGSSFGGAFDNSSGHYSGSASLWSTNRASSGITVAATSSGRGKGSVPSIRGHQPRPGMMSPSPSQPSASTAATTTATSTSANQNQNQNQTQNQIQDLGSMNSTIISQTRPSLSQESGAGVTLFPPTQATSIQSSQQSSQLFLSQARSSNSSQGLELRIGSSTPFGSASPSPAPPPPGPSTLTHPMPLSTQSSLSSAGFSIPESISSLSGSGDSGGSTTVGTQHRDNKQRQQGQIGPRRTTRQNPTRRFDPVVSPAPGSSSSSSLNMNTTLTQTSVTQQQQQQQSLNLAQNRPRDTFNALAAQIASEFRTPASGSGPISSAANSSNSITRNSRSTGTRSRPRPRPQPQPRLLRSSRKKKQAGAGEGESQSEGSLNEEEDEESNEDEDEDEYVPSGSARKSGRRR